MPPNILLLILDSVRAKNTQLHDYRRETTPYLSAFANRATTYKQARAPGIHSIASHASIFTGSHVAEHQLISHGHQINPSSTIWTNLGEMGYNTALFTPNAVITKSTNFGEAFDLVTGPQSRRSIPFSEAMSPSTVENINNTTKIEYLQMCLNSGQPIRAIANGITELVSDQIEYHSVDESAEVYVSEFLDWQSQCSEPWAACINLMDAHYPYRPKGEYNRWAGAKLNSLHRKTRGPYSTTFLSDEYLWKLSAFEALYDGGIRQADAHINTLISTLESRNELEDTLVVITSDHGEGFGEPSELEPAIELVDHSWGVSEAITHVPLLVKSPGQTESEIITRPATLTKFPDVVRSVINDEQESARFVPDGPVFASTQRVQSPTEALPASCSEPNKYAGPWRAVYEWRDNTVWKFSRRGESGLTQLIPNADERQIISRDEEMLRSKYDALDSDLTVSMGDSNLDADVRSHLKELGYL